MSVTLQVTLSWCLTETMKCNEAVSIWQHDGRWQGHRLLLVTKSSVYRGKKKHLPRPLLVPHFVIWSSHNLTCQDEFPSAPSIYSRWCTGSGNLRSWWGPLWFLRSTLVVGAQGFEFFWSGTNLLDGLKTYLFIYFMKSFCRDKVKKAFMGRRLWKLVASTLFLM